MKGLEKTGEHDIFFFELGTYIFRLTLGGY
jgi:hypothetical protein